MFNNKDDSNSEIKIDYNEIETYFTCPISLEIMKNPVICDDGHSYEKEHISKYMENKKISPITRTTISKIIPNITLKNIIIYYGETIEQFKNLQIKYNDLIIINSCLKNENYFYCDQKFHYENMISNMSSQHNKILTDFDNENKVMVSNNKVLKSELNKIEKEILKLKDDNTNLSLEYKKLISTNSDLISQNKIYKDKVDKFVVSINENIIKNNKLTSVINLLEKENFKLKDDNKKICFDKNKLDNINNELTNENKIYKDKIDKMVKSNNENIIQNNKLINTNDLLEKDNFKLKEDNAKLSLTHNNLKITINSLYYTYYNIKYEYFISNKIMYGCHNINNNLKLLNLINNPCLHKLLTATNYSLFTIKIIIK